MVLKYRKPTILQIRLEEKVAKAADKWARVEALVKQEHQPTMNELAQFVVKLLQEK